MNRRIIKVGGSLFGQSDLADRLQRWLTVQSSAKNIFVAGGGPMADCVRQWNQRFVLTEDVCHAMCLTAMSQTSLLLNQLMPHLPICDSAPAVDSTGDCIVDPHRWCRDQAELEPSWNTTSDTIAAWLARAVGARELILLKCVLPVSRRLEDWFRESVVDQNFARHAMTIDKVVVANFLDPDFSVLTASK